MSTAVVNRPRTLLPKFNLLLAGGAAVLSIIAISESAGSTTTPARATPAVTVTVPARPQHAPAGRVAIISTVPGVCGLRIGSRC